MAQGKQALKGRIRSVSATRKITSAMELIANAKLQKQRVQKRTGNTRIRCARSSVRFWRTTRKANAFI